MKQINLVLRGFQLGYIPCSRAIQIQQRPAHRAARYCIGTQGRIVHAGVAHQFVWDPVEDAEVLSFVRNCINSVWTLELLLLLHRDPARSWHAQDLIASLHANAQIITESMAILLNLGIATSADGSQYRYAPNSPATVTVIDALAELYAKKPVAVVKTIFSSPSEKIQTFANAFRFKR